MIDALRHTAGTLNRAQQTTLFKLIASAVVVVIALSVVVTYAVSVRSEQLAGNTEAGAVSLGGPDAAARSQTPIGDQAQADEQLRQRRATEEAAAKAIQEILDRRLDITAVAIGAATATGVALLIIWLGLGLTYFALLCVTSLVVVPMVTLLGDTSISLFGSRHGIKETMPLRFGDVGKFIAAVVALTAAFTALMRGLSLALEGNGAVRAIARNVVAEAVRMKVSLVFMVLLVFAMAALPGLLDAQTPLRYRVQNFLQYGTGGSYWIIATLVVFLSVGTVAFEQRDRVIWQTMTKPVAAWQYLLGKWLGVVGVAAVLLAVTTSGVFLFTEYLRNQPALGESHAYVAREGGVGGTGLTEDRLALEEQILSARASTRPTLPGISPEDLQQEIQRRLQAERISAVTVDMEEQAADTPAARRRIFAQIRKEFDTAYFTIDPADSRVFRFEGLTRAKQLGRPMTIRYRVNAGGNDPRESYRVTFAVPSAPPIVRQVPLDQTLSLPLSAAAIGEDGAVELFVLNGDWYERVANETSINFPPDGIELFYAAGSYRMNFLRVAFILWLKLAFMAMVGVCAATFLSFPVASLTSFGVLFMAEGAGFLRSSLDYFGGAWNDPDFSVFRFAIRCIAVPITAAFKFYSDLRPTAHLVDGYLLPWSRVASSVFILGLLIVLLYAVGVLIFRRRELATYSGQ